MEEVVKKHYLSTILLFYVCFDKEGFTKTESCCFQS